MRLSLYRLGFPPASGWLIIVVHPCVHIPSLFGLAKAESARDEGLEMKEGDAAQLISPAVEGSAVTESQVLEEEKAEDEKAQDEVCPPLFLRLPLT